MRWIMNRGAGESETRMIIEGERRNGEVLIDSIGFSKIGEFQSADCWFETQVGRRGIPINNRFC